MVIQTFIDWFYAILDRVWGWGIQIYDRFDLDYASLLLALLIIGAMSRYLLRPFIGSAFSDSAKKGKKHANDS